MSRVLKLDKGSTSHVVVAQRLADATSAAYAEAEARKIATAIRPSPKLLDTQRKARFDPNPKLHRYFPSAGVGERVDTAANHLVDARGTKVRRLLQSLADKEIGQTQELVFVGDLGMVKSNGKQALNQAPLHYLTART